MKRILIFLFALCPLISSFGQTKKFSTDSLRVNNFLAVRLPASAFAGFGDGVLGAMGIVILSDTTDASSFSIGQVGGSWWLMSNNTGSGSDLPVNIVIGVDAVAHFNADNNFGVAGQSTFGTSATNTIGIPNGTAPSTSPANAVQIYSEDVSGSAELKVRDEAGNVTVLSTSPSFIWSKSGEATQSDSIRFVQGSNVTLTRSGNALTIAASSGTASGWTLNGTEVELSTNTDEIVIGGTAAINSAKVTIDGDADQVQLIIQGHSTQTTDYALFENSAGTDIFRVYNTSNAAVAVLQPTASGGQAYINLLRSAGINTGFGLISDAQGDNTDIFSVYRRVDGFHTLIIDAQGDVTIGSDGSSPNTMGWADLSIDGDAGTATIGMSNETLGHDATSGLLISVPTTGAVTIKSFDGDIEINSADNGKEFIVDIADDNDNDLFVDDNGLIGIGSTSFGTSAAKVLSMGNGTAPSTSPVDVFQIWSEDVSAGNASAIIRNEGGNSGFILHDAKSAAVAAGAGIFVINSGNAGSGSNTGWIPIFHPTLGNTVYVPYVLDPTP